MTTEQLNRKRQAANKKILFVLEQIIDKHPELRFAQILSNCGFLTSAGGRDLFYEEPGQTLKRIKSFYDRC